MSKVVDFDLAYFEVEVQSCNYVPFWTNIFGKGMKSLIFPGKGSNNVTAVLLQNGSDIK